MIIFKKKGISNVLLKRECERLRKERDRLLTKLNEIEQYKQDYEALINEVTILKERYESIIRKTENIFEEYTGKLSNLINTNKQRAVRFTNSPHVQ